MKLEVEFTDEKPPAGPTLAKDVPVGTVFFGAIRDDPSVYLKVFEGVVDLQKPGETWSFSGSRGPEIDNYRPATVAKLVVG